MPHSASHFVSPVLDTIDDAVTRAAGVSLRLLRLDLVHPLLPGNKWYKLRLNLEEARSAGHTTLLSFGGAYSNHLHALAAAGNLFGFRTIGMVRGELLEPLNPTLSFARSQGMELHAVSREAYRHRRDPAFFQHLMDRFGNFFLIPEGGGNVAGVRGCAEIAKSFDWSAEPPLRHVILSCGTGATLAGILAGLTAPCHVTGMAVLKGGEFLQKEVSDFLSACDVEDPGRWHINADWHFGGYGRVTDDLLDFIRTFKQGTDIALEPIYTGKMMMGLYAMLARGAFPHGSEIIAIHTGGLQGWQSSDRSGLSV